MNTRPVTSVLATAFTALPHVLQVLDQISGEVSR